MGIRVVISGVVAASFLAVAAATPAVAATNVVDGKMHDEGFGVMTVVETGSSDKAAKPPNAPTFPTLDPNCDRPPEDIRAPATWDEKEQAWIPGEVIGQQTFPSCRSLLADGTTLSWLVNGMATWPASEQVFTVEEMGYGGGAGGVSRGTPSPLPPPVDSVYTGQCTTVFESLSAGVGALPGYRAPLGVRWSFTRTEVWRYAGPTGPAGSWVRTDSDPSIGECVWPGFSVKEYRCPLRIWNGLLQGPFPERGSVVPSGASKGLPVESGIGKFDPDSVYRATPYSAVQENKIAGYVLRGEGGGRKAVPYEEMSICEKNLLEFYDFRVDMRHPGNYRFTADGYYAYCSFVKLEPSGPIKSNGCTEPFRDRAKADGHRTCPTALDLVSGFDRNTNFKCSLPTEIVICNGKATIPCPGTTLTTDDPGDFVDPGRDPVICYYDRAQLRTPEGRDLDINGVTFTIGATGEQWRLQWGDMLVANAPGREEEWTNFYVKGGSSPAKPALIATDERQPFLGEWNGTRVLMWDDLDSEKGRGVQGPPWAKFLDMHWYMAGATSTSTYTAYQDRKFMWTYTGSGENLDGSRWTYDVKIPQSCESARGTFRVVKGRNAGG